MPKAQLKTELSNRAVVLGEGELTLASLAEAVNVLDLKGVAAGAKVIVHQPPTKGGPSRWSVVATWDPEGVEF